jgi:hypothetical protein
MAHRSQKICHVKSRKLAGISEKLRKKDLKKVRQEVLEKTGPGELSPLGTSIETLLTPKEGRKRTKICNPADKSKTWTVKATWRNKFQAISAGKSTRKHEV